MEKERTRLRNSLIKYEEENKKLVNECEEVRIENIEVKKQLEIFENKIGAQQEIRDDKINQQLSAIKELEQEIDVKNKKIRELLKEKLAAEKRAQEDFNSLRDELDVTKEQIIHFQKNEAMLDVYKKKILEMAQIKSDLKDF